MHVSDNQTIDPLVGHVLVDRFQILELVDRGGMGKVYKAEQQPLGRVVAVKTLDIVDRRGEYRERFFLEASTVARLNHPNTIRIFDYDATDDGVYFIAMEFLDGVPLSHALRRGGAMLPLRAIHIARQVCSALDEAHRQSLIHRDLKPGNIFLVNRGGDPDFVKLLDFGLVKDMEQEAGLSRSGQVLGSPHYMAPEQVEGGAVDARTDIYSIGVLLFAMLTGKRPFNGDNTLAVMLQQAHKDPPTFADVAPDLHLPASLEWVVQACLRKNPDERPGSVSELDRALSLCARELRSEIEPVLFHMAEGGRILPPGGSITTASLPSANDLPDLSGIDLVAPTSSSAPDAPSGTLASPTTNTSSVGKAAAAGGLALAALLVGLGLVLVVAVGVSLWWLGHRDVAPVVVEPPIVDAEPVAVPQERPVEVVTTPAGADVLRGEALLGSTPLTLSLPAGESWTLTLQLPDHRDRTVLVDGSTAQVRVTMREAAPTVAPTPRPRDPEPDPDPQLGNEIRDPWSTP